MSQRLLNATEKVWKDGEGQKYVSFCIGYNTPTLLEIYKSRVSRASTLPIMVLGDHDFSYYSLTPHPTNRLPPIRQ